MKKHIFRILAVVLCLIMAASVVACTEDGSEAATENGGNKPVSSSFSVRYNGTEIKLGSNWNGIESKLGTPAGSLPTGNCGGKGETYRYDYSALAITVVHYTDGEPLVDIISFKNDAATTDKGIYIGSSKSDVVNAYGQPTEENESSVKYVNGDAEFTFGITDGKVNSITLKKNG